MNGPAHSGIKSGQFRTIKNRLLNREWRLDNLYYVKDPAGQKVLFVRNDAQRSFWSDVHYLNVILKARQLGFSTFIDIVMLDACLWNSNTTAGIVDATIDDAKGKLDKIRFAYENLPEALKLVIPLVQDNATSLEWGNGSAISVSTSHRGGTNQLLHVSEYGKISVERPQASKEIRSGAFGTVHRGNLIFVESTAKGVGGDFHDLVQDAEALAASGRPLSQSDFKLHFYPWWQHTGYTEDPELIPIPQEMAAYFDELKAKHGVSLTPGQRAWYCAKVKQIGLDEMYREYPSFPQEAFKASIEGAYFKTQMLKAREQGRIGKVPLDPSRPVHTCWDIGKDDNTSVWFFQSHGQMIHHIDYYENSGEGVEHYARVLNDKRSARGWTYGKHYGPHDLDNSHWILPGSKAIVDVARELGIVFEVVPRVANKQDAIEAARNWLGFCWFDEAACAQGIARLDNYRKEWDDKRGHFKSEPLHDANSHGADAFMTGACGHTPDYIPPPSDRYRRKHATGRSAWAA